MKKKLLSVLICAAMAVTMLSACGGTKEAEAPATEEPVAEEPAAEEPVAEEPAAEEPAAEEPAAEEPATESAIKKIVPEGDIVVGISTGSSGTSWRDIMIADLETVGKEYKEAGKIKDYKIVNNTTNGDANEQAQILRSFVDDPEVNVILVNPNDNTALTEVIAEAQAAGKLVVVFDATAESPGALNVTLDHYVWNTKNVEAISAAQPSGNAVEISGLDGHPANNDRVRATTDVLKNFPDINLLQSTPGGWDQTKAKEVMAQILASGQEVDIVYTQDGMADGALSAFLDAGKLPKAMFGDPGTAFFKKWNELREQGADFKAFSQPNPPGIGGTAFRLALQLAEGKEMKEEVLDGNIFFYTVGSFFTDENFDEAWDVLKDKPDDYLLSEIMSEEDAAALFK